MLVHRPKTVICKVGTYDIIVSSDNTVEDEAKFHKFCQEFKAVLMMMVGQATKPTTDSCAVGPVVAHEGVS